jgi:hypothetical protein
MTAELYMGLYLENVYLYTDNDLTQKTVRAKTPGDVGGFSETVFHIGGEPESLDSLQRNIDYLQDKAAYWKYMRQAEGIYRTDFQIEFAVNSIDVTETAATVEIAAGVSFRYLDRETPSFTEDIFVVSLVKCDSEWLVADVVQLHDWFDAQHKNDSDFDVEQVIQDYRNTVNPLPEPSPVETEPPS